MIPSPPQVLAAREDELKGVWESRIEELVSTYLGFYSLPYIYRISEIVQGDLFNWPPPKNHKF